MTTLPTKFAEADADTARALKIIESMPGHAWSASATGTFTYISPSTLAYFGGRWDDLDLPDGEDEFGWRRVVHPEDYDRVAARWRHCLQTGDHYDTEHRLRRADGVYRWFRNSGRPSRDSQGRITAWYGTTTDIDDQKQAEAALHDRERELSQLVNMVPSHLWRLTPDGEPTFFNKRMVDFLGMDVAGTVKPGMTRLEAFTETIHPDDAAEFKESLGRCLATGETFATRYRLRRVDGVYRWMSSRAEPMRDHAGRIMQWYGLCHDVDEQVHAEEALRQSERQLQQLVDAVPATIWCTAPDGTPTYRNKRHTHVTGVTLEDLTAPDGSLSPLTTLAHPDDRAAASQVRAHAFETGSPYHVRYRQLRRDGTYRWTESRAEPLRDESGEILQWYAVSVDIHDLVSAQEALKRSEQELSELVNMLPVHIRRLTPEGETVFFNKRLVDFTGMDLAELSKRGMSGLGGTIQTLIHPDDTASLQETIRHSLATGESYATRYRARRADGMYRWMEGRGEPLRDQSGAIVQWYGISIDIDDEVRAQQAEEGLREISDKLAKATQIASLAELSASIAHEVNQPLAAIVANSNACHRWLSVEPPNLQRAKITVERITKDANSAADVVSRIRALFRQTPHARLPEDINCLISEVCQLMADEIVAKGTRLETNVEVGLPSVQLDRVQVQQVLVNLIRNGIEAMDSVDDRPRLLQIRSCRDGLDAIRVEVRDAGTGFREAERACEPFFTTKQHGMGMGLAICRSIIETHGGRLWAANSETCGATVAFTLPLAAAVA